MGAIAVTDEELPANCAQVCYFIQFFDEHGNPSPLSDLGCVTTTSKVDLPVPILGQILDPPSTGDGGPSRNSRA